jgi:hypothetical protein
MKDRKAVLLQRDRLYAEHMHKVDNKRYAGNQDRVVKPLDALDMRKPGMLEQFVMWLLG